MAFPSTDLDIIVQAYLGADPTADPGDWPAATDLSSRLLRQPIQIRRGRGKNQRTAAAGSCTFWLDNTDGALTPLLATSTYYPDWDLGVPLDLSVDNVGANPPYVRHAGFVAEIKAVIIPGVGGDNISAVQVTSAGVLRRLTQGSVAKSAMFRTITGQGAEEPFAYWSLDDGPLSESGVLTSGSGTNFVSLDWGDAVDPGSEELASWLGPGVSLSGDTAIIATVPLGTVTRVVIDAVYRFNDVDSASIQSCGFTLASVASFATGSRWPVQLDSASGSGTITAGNPDAGAATSVNTNAILGGPHHLRLDLTDTGADVNYVVYLDGVQIISATATTANFADHHFVRMFNDEADGSTSIWTDFVMWVDVTPPDVTVMASAAAGYAGEEAHERFERVCGEEGITYSGTASGSVAMGPQPVADVVAVLRDCETVDHGMIIEDFAFGLNYRSSRQRENLPPSMTVDLSTYKTTSGTQGDVLAPVRNDARIRNEWAISRPEGSTKTAKDATHQARHGRYNDSATVNVEDDNRILDEAYWRVHEGTFDGLRYDTVPVDLGANE